MKQPFRAHTTECWTRWEASAGSPLPIRLCSWGTAVKLSYWGPSSCGQLSNGLYFFLIYPLFNWSKFLMVTVIWTGKKCARRRLWSCVCVCTTYQTINWNEGLFEIRGIKNLHVKIFIRIPQELVSTSLSIIWSINDASDGYSRAVDQWTHEILMLQERQNYFTEIRRNRE